MDKTQMKTRKLTTVAASITALYSFSGMANAELVYKDSGLSVNSSPLTPNTAEWDIDGDNSVDFTFSVITSNKTSNFYLSTTNVKIRGFGVGSNKFFNTPFNIGDPISGLASSKVTSLDFATFSVFKSYGSASSFGSVAGDFLYGFEFNLDGNKTLGWADITLVALGLNETSLTINNWCYEKDSKVTPTAGDSDCKVSSVDVPEPPIASLLLLGLGAAGVRRWRDQKRLRDAS